MKNLSTTINETINESRQIEYRVALTNCLDKNGLPMSVIISIDNTDMKHFEAYLTDEEGNTFLHAEGGNIEY
jgi:hypothetical protein